MVRKVNDFYQCEACKLLYKDSFWAESCEVWCKEYNSCNLEITQHAIKNQESENDE
jgi:hypothetical protein